MRGSILYTFLIITLLFSLALRHTDATYFPFGHPDLDIDLRKQSFQPIPAKENLNFILEDLNKLPIFVKEITLPAVREQFIKHKDILINQYIESVTVLHNLEDDTIKIKVNTLDDSVSEQTVRVKQAHQKMSVFSEIGMYIAVYRDVRTAEEIADEIALDLYLSTLDKVEEFTISRTEVLALYATEVLNLHRDKLFVKTDEMKANQSTNLSFIGHISLKMLDGDIARISVFSQNDQGSWVKAIDEVKTGVQIIPEFPISIMVASIAIAFVLGIMRLTGVKLFLH